MPRDWIRRILLLRLSELSPYLLLCKLSGIAFEESHSIVQSHQHLITDRYHAFSECPVVLEQEPYRNHDIVDIVEDEGVL